VSAFRFDGIVINAIGEALPGVLVYVCTQPNSIDPDDPTIPPTPLASLFTDATGGTSATNPVTVNGNGNFYFYAASAFYTLVYHDPSGRIPDQVYPDQACLSTGSGTVTSVALSMPAEFSVAGSPIVGAGTFAVTKAVQNANLVWAGPASGSAAAPTFRALVTADFPGAIGTVTSVAASLSTGTLLTGSVTGSPITTSGTLAFTVGIANQSAHFFLAGPTSGGSGPTTSRAIVPSDLPGGTTVSSSASMTFDASTNSSFRIAMSSSVTSSSVTNPTARQRITFIIAENGTGGWTFAYPSNFRGASVIQTDANGVNIQSFVYDEVTSMWRADGPGSWNAT